MATTHPQFYHYSYNQKNNREEGKEENLRPRSMSLTSFLPSHPPPPYSGFHEQIFISSQQQQQQFEVQYFIETPFNFQQNYYEPYLTTHQQPQFIFSQEQSQHFMYQQLLQHQPEKLQMQQLQPIPPQPQQQILNQPHSQSQPYSKTQHHTQKQDSFPQFRQPELKQQQNLSPQQQNQPQTYVGTPRPPPYNPTFPPLTDEVFSSSKNWLLGNKYKQINNKIKNNQTTAETILRPKRPNSTGEVTSSLDSLLPPSCTSSSSAFRSRLSRTFENEGDMINPSRISVSMQTNTFALVDKEAKRVHMITGSRRLSIPIHQLIDCCFIFNDFLVVITTKIGHVFDRDCYLHLTFNLEATNPISCSEMANGQVAVAQSNMIIIYKFELQRNGGKICVVKSYVRKIEKKLIQEGERGRNKIVSIEINGVKDLSYVLKKGWLAVVEMHERLVENKKRNFFTKKASFQVIMERSLTVIDEQGIVQSHFDLSLDNFNLKKLPFDLPIYINSVAISNQQELFICDNTHIFKYKLQNSNYSNRPLEKKMLKEYQPNEYKLWSIATNLQKKQLYVLLRRGDIIEIRVFDVS